VASGITIINVFVREPFEGLPAGGVIRIEQPDEGEVSYNDAGVVVSFRNRAANREQGRPSAHVHASLLVPYWNVLAVRREFV
jgi:hypothetical protein